MNFRTKLIIGLLIFSSHSFAGDFELTPAFQKAYIEVFKYKVRTGKNILLNEKKDSPFRAYLENYIDLIELLNTDDEEYYEKIKHREGERLDLIEDLDAQSPYNRFLRAEIKMHWALNKLRFGHEFKAAYNIIEAAKLLEENQKLFPGFLPNYKSLGCLHIIIGSVPDNFRWALKILGLKGSVNQGLIELDKAEKDPIWGNEALYCSYYIQAFVTKLDEREQAELMKFMDNQPDNLNVHFIGLAVSMRSNNAEQAHKILKKLPTGSEYIPCPILDLYRADVALMKGQYQHANGFYANYLRNPKIKAFVKDTYYKLFLSNYLMHNDKQALAYLLKIPSVGYTVSEGDKAAEKFYESYAKNRALPDKDLLKAKLALDGGYFPQALSLIETISEQKLSTQKEKTEYFYLAGKAFQKNGQSDKAINYFEKSITFNEKQQWYFGAGSALQLGYIFQEKAQKNQAKVYFEKALSYKNHEYKNTIDGKARAALSEMGFKINQ
jgi:tetratricopeptide (TPR) repeat protein